MRAIVSFLCAALTAALVPGLALAATIDTKAQFAYMLDYDSGQVLLAKQAEVEMHPSSMSKMMTLYVLFSRMKEGRVKPEDMFTVSEKAWKMEGSRMFVQVGTQVKVDDLINGIIIDSGNDACVTVAEGVSGSEAAFADAMNEAAAKIGLTQSHFMNATGLPDPQHLMTARDLAILARHLITDFPEYYHYFSGKSFTYNNITQQNRNLLDGNDIGVDGLKTGHTDEAGFGITLSAKDAKSGRRLILVINGLGQRQGPHRRGRPPAALGHPRIHQQAGGQSRPAGGRGGSVVRREPACEAGAAQGYVDDAAGPRCGEDDVHGAL